MNIDANTALYAVFGNPVRHSKGPLVHNTCFGHYQQNAVYLAFEIAHVDSAVQAMRTLDVKGASITIPHKSSILELLDYIDTDARNIGAVNTVVNRDGRLEGYNTDYKAAVLPLQAQGLKDKHVCILGAGGAAQAVAYGIKRQQASFTILNRSDEKGISLASRFGGQFINIEDQNAISDLTIDILINTTPVGMVPHTDETPFPTKFLHPELVVMDIVYNPLETLLLKQAQKLGCRTVTGLSMFLYQAAAQFELWTGINPDLNIMKKAITHGK